MDTQGTVGLHDELGVAKKTSEPRCDASQSWQSTAACSRKGGREGRRKEGQRGGGNEGGKSAGAAMQNLYFLLSTHKDVVPQ